MAFRRFTKHGHSKREHFNGKHRFEHWYCDNSVYFITSKVRDGFHAFQSEEAKLIFWDRFNHYTNLHTFTPWVTTLLDNHYHTLGYLRDGSQLGEMMRKLHGSIAWLVMKETGQRHAPFWRGKGGRDYFDGCIRDVLQADRAYRYTLNQAVRARLVKHWEDYAHTRVNVETQRAIKRAVELKAFMEDVPYARYERHRQKKRPAHQR